MKGKRELSIDFHASVQSAVSKLAALDTQQTAHEEIRAVLTRCARNEHCINSFLAALSNVNEQSLSPMQRKEFIKLYGYIAEVLEGDCIPFIPKLVSIMQKKLKESNPHLHEAIAASFGSLIHNTMHTFPDIQSSCGSLGAVLKVLFANLNTGNKILQNGSALSLTKVIQHSPLECLRYLLDRITPKILDTLTGTSFKGHAALVESLINLILSLEKEFEPYVEHSVNTMIQCLNSSDFMTRKHCIDAIYTIGAVLPETAKPLAANLISVINTCRADKSKPVRDAALEALAVYKHLQPEGVVSRPQTAQSKEIRQKSIFRGPVNRDFFKTPDDIAEGPLVEILTEKPQKKTVEEEKKPAAESPPVFSAFEEIEEEKVVESIPVHTFKPTSWFNTETTEVEVQPPVHGISLEQKAAELEKQNAELATQLDELTQHTRSELNFMSQRLSAIEDMVSTIGQLFEAKFAQILNNPRLSSIVNQ